MARPVAAVVDITNKLIKLLYLLPCYSCNVHQR